jgi:hypothetical protein
MYDYIVLQIDKEDLFKIYNVHRGTSITNSIDIVSSFDLINDVKELVNESIQNLYMNDKT